MERPTASDEKGKIDAATFHVASFAEKECKIDQTSSSIGWAIPTKKSKKDKGAVPFQIVLLQAHLRRLQDEESPFLSSPYLDSKSNVTGLKRGRQLRSLSVPIRACVGTRRPQVLYRVIHDGHPGNGLQSRGSGTIKIDSLSFMIHFIHHLDWKRRDASPFMSTTSDCAKAATLAARYERKGFNNIEVLVIRVTGSDWPTQSVMWDVRGTAARLGLCGELVKPYYDNEYLIEDHIPASCVTRVRWEDMKSDITAEVSEMEDSRKRKRGVFESDGQEDETLLSGGRVRHVWGLVENHSKVKQQCYYTRRADFK